MATVQIRNLDDGAYQKLKERAALQGQSLQEYLRLMLERSAGQPNPAEVLARVRAEMNWTEGEAGPTTADIVEIQRAMRDR